MVLIVSVVPNHDDDDIYDTTEDREDYDLSLAEVLYTKAEIESLR